MDVRVILLSIKAMWILLWRLLFIREIIIWHVITEAYAHDAMQPRLVGCSAQSRPHGKTHATCTINYNISACKPWCNESINKIMFQVLSLFYFSFGPSSQFDLTENDVSISLRLGSPIHRQFRWPPANGALPRGCHYLKIEVKARLWGNDFDTKQLAFPVLGVVAFSSLGVTSKVASSA